MDRSSGKKIKKRNVGIDLCFRPQRLNRHTNLKKIMKIKMEIQLTNL